MRPLSFCYDQYGAPSTWNRDLAQIVGVERRAFVRHDAVWEYIDSSGQGRYAWTGSPSLDARVALVLSKRLRNHLVVPMWAPASFRSGAPSKTQIKTEDALGAFTEFCRALGKHLGPKVRSWEPGNEPNLKNPFAPDGADPEWQAQVTNAVALVVPSSWRLITPGLAPASDGSGSLSPLTYLETYWAALTPEVQDKVHAVGIHPYGRASDADESWSVLGKLDDIHDLTGKPLWATEQNTDGNDNDAQRATNEPLALTFLQNLDYVERTFVYAMSDPGTDSSVRWGCTTKAGKPRPILGAIRSWATANREDTAASEAADPVDAHA